MADFTPGWAVQVQWDGSTWSTVTVQDLSVSHGASPSSNPDRPTVLPAYGLVTVRGKLTAAQQVARRFTCRIRVGGATCWQGWIQEPQVVPGAAPLVSWLLEGLTDTPLEQDLIVNRSAGTVAAWVKALGATAAELQARNLKAVTFDGRRGEALSLLAAVASATVLERADGSVLFAGNTLSSAPSGPVVLASSALRVLLPSTQARADRIRNRATVVRLGDQRDDNIALPASLDLVGVPSGRTYSTGTPIPLARNRVALTGSASVAVPQDGATYSGWAVAITSARMELNTRTTGRVAPFIDTYTWVDVPGSAPTPTLSVAGGRASAAISFAGPVQPDTPTYTWQGVNNTHTFPPMSQQSQGKQDGYWLYATDGSGGIARGPRTIRVGFEFTATRTTGTPPKSVVRDNADSIATWGLRPLDIPDWLSGNTDLQSTVNSLAQLRHEHVVTLPLRQPTSQLSARIAGIDAGDYVALNLQDNQRNVDIQQYCLVTQRSLRWSATAGGYIDLRCLEVGQPYTP